ncbi:hypothetical protein [Micromonospora sp. WMMD998]|uniref:hypothetical protein n=1 Tax=Micromonospora sp. WMMD998 TaxID=3016092 RepID=UPI00249B99B9|nr:hypothetical protein [Micromonospora sp. WMMD998]WFE38263.1 hypothetical protein O7619_07390 [Micromonospora sp. WMMD998]
MTRPRPPRRTLALFAPALVAAAAAVVTVAPGWATATSASPATVVRAAGPDAPGDPGDDPGGEPGGEPTPTEATTTATAPAPPTEEAPTPTTPAVPAATTALPPTTAPPSSAPATTAPTSTASARPPVVPPVQPPPPPRTQPAGGPLGVQVSTDDVVLTPGYWNADSTVTTLRVTVANTGGRAEEVSLGYTLPAGLADAGTPGCVDAGGGNHRCGGWTASPGARFSTTIRVRVAGDAWRTMPLSGSVQVTAVAPGVDGAAYDDEGFAVLFPPGPPVPGISLRTEEVHVDLNGASTLTVRLGNTGSVDAAGRVEVLLPAGVTVSGDVRGCVPADPGRTRCGLGTLPAGRAATLRLPLTASAEAQRTAPLAGAVIGRLDPRSGPHRQVQMSFRISAAAARATPAVGAPAPTWSEGVLAAAGRSGGPGTPARRIAIVLIVMSGLLVVFALTLATRSLRRRSDITVADPTTDR